MKKRLTQITALFAIIGLSAATSPSRDMGQVDRLLADDPPVICIPFPMCLFPNPNPNPPPPPPPPEEELAPSHYA